MKITYRPNLYWEAVGAFFLGADSTCSTLLLLGFVIEGLVKGKFPSDLLMRSVVELPAMALVISFVLSLSFKSGEETKGLNNLKQRGLLCLKYANPISAVYYTLKGLIWWPIVKLLPKELGRYVLFVGILVLSVVVGMCSHSINLGFFVGLILALIFILTVFVLGMNEL